MASTPSKAKKFQSASVRAGSANTRRLLRRELEQSWRERIEDHLIGHPGAAHLAHCRGCHRLLEFVVRITMRRERLQLDNQDAAQLVTCLAIEMTSSSFFVGLSG